MRGEKKRSRFLPEKYTFFSVPNTKRKTPTLSQSWPVSFLCSLSHKYTHPACDACLWWGACKCKADEPLLCPSLQTLVLSRLAKSLLAKAVFAWKQWSTWDKIYSPSLKPVRDMPLQNPAVQAVTGAFRQSKRNLFSESTAQRRKAPPCQHFWVDQEWLKSGVTLFTGLPTLAHNSLFFPHADSPFRAVVLPPLSPVVVLSPPTLPRQMPSRKRSPPRHHVPSAWGAHTPWQVF